MIRSGSVPHSRLQHKPGRHAFRASSPRRSSRRFHVQLFALLVADHHRIFATGLADALFGRAGKDSFHARQVAGSSCVPGCLPLFGLFVDTGDGGGSGSRSASASTSWVLTPGSRSNSKSCASLSGSLFGPYLRISSSRSRSSRERISVPPTPVASSDARPLRLRYGVE